MEINHTSSQAYSVGSDTKYTWRYIVCEFGMAYQKRYHQIAKSQESITTLGIWSRASDWLNPPLGPPSENWLRESNRFNSKRRTIYDRGKDQCTRAFTKCEPS